MPSPSNQRPIILASSSPYRRQLLEKIHLSFTCCSPNIDESALPGETARDLVERLALAKAKAVAQHSGDALIIGADQVADIEGEIIGKPSNHEAAVRQLQRASGKVVSVYTGLALYDALSGSFQLANESFIVEMRELERDLIERYLHQEQPYDCCGSLKTDGLGIVLVKRLSGDDPNAIIGLPMIRLIDMLTQAGVELV